MFIYWDCCIYLNDFMYLFLTVLGLHCCMGFSLVAASSGSSLVVTRRLLISVACLVADPYL